MAEESPERLASVAAKIDALGPGPELDARSAQVIGWEVLGVTKRFSRGVKPDSEDRAIIPRYSTDPSAVFELEEKVLESENAAAYIGHLSASVMPAEGGAYCEAHLIAIAHAEPDVRCRAVLKASMKIPVEKVAAPRSGVVRVRRAVRQPRVDDGVELL